MGGRTGKSVSPAAPGVMGRRSRERAESQGDAVATPFDLAKKLRAAVQAKDLRALERLFQRPEVGGMDDRSVAFVVRTAVEQHYSSALAVMFSQAAVQDMGPRAIAGLLQTAILHKNVSAVLQLCQLKAAHDINTAYLSYLLGEAMRLGHEGAVKSLSALQGHQTELEQLVPAGSFAGALRTAVLQGRRQMVYHMCVENEDVQSMEPGIMSGILGTAIYHRSGVITRYLCWVQAAQRLPADSVCELLGAALQVGDSQAIWYICEELPGAQQLAPEHINKLLLAAMRQPDTPVLCRLCHLPAAQALTAADAAALLETAVTDTAVCGEAEAVCALCELLPGAQSLGVEQLRQLLRVALPQNSRGATLGHLHRLPAARELRKTKDSAVCLVPVNSKLPTAEAAAAAAAAEEEAASSSAASRSRSSSPSSGGRLGRSSSSSSSSSSPVSRRSRSSTASSDCGPSSGKGCGSGGVADVLCRELESSCQLLQLERLEELLLPC